MLYELIEKQIFYLEAAGFKVDAFICDGCSVNVTVVKQFLLDNNGTIDLSKPVIPHPVDENRFLVFIMCNSHVLKNIRNALFNPKRNMTKDQLKICCSALRDIYFNDLKRVDSGQFKLCPTLTYNCLWLTSWSKMSVPFAKRVFDERVIAQIKVLNGTEGKYFEQFDSLVGYLESVWTIFTRCLLNKKLKVKDRQHRFVVDLVNALDYFTE